MASGHETAPQQQAEHMAAPTSSAASFIRSLTTGRRPHMALKSRTGLSEIQWQSGAKPPLAHKPYENSQNGMGKLTKNYFSEQIPI
jgi:hypothetical protein